MSNKFNTLELERDISEMSGEDAKETLAAFMEVHEKNAEVHTGLEMEFSDYKEEVSEELQDLEDLKTKFSEQAAEGTTFDPERFMSFSAMELYEEASRKIEGAFSQVEAPEEGEEAAEEEAPEGLRFSTNPSQAGKVEAEETSDSAQFAQRQLSRAFGGDY